MADEWPSKTVGGHYGGGDELDEEAPIAT